MAKIENLNAKRRAKYASDPSHREKVLARAKARHDLLRSDPEYISARREAAKAAREKRNQDPSKRERERARARQLKYGVSPSDIALLRAEQGGRCRICSVPMLPGSKAHDGECVDHDHRSGKVRGLLCNSCNFRLGFFERTRHLHEKFDTYLLANA